MVVNYLHDPLFNLLEPCVVAFYLCFILGEINE